MPELDWSDMPTHLAIKADRKTPERLIEGSLGSAKTTIAIDCELDAILRHPGIPVLWFRWSEDAVATKLKPAVEEVMAIRGIESSWDAKQKRFDFPNGSTAYMFGLKAVSAVEMFNKIRGLGVSRIMGDQVEEMQQEVAAELRGRLRPNLTATMSGHRFPFQLTFVANPSDTEFWLSKEFLPDSHPRHVAGRKLYSLSVFDNKHLPQESVESLLRQFPPEHPKNVTMVMGQRGPNITGVPVYEGIYKRKSHERTIALRPDAPIVESFEFGKHNPVWVYGQPMYAGGLAVLGGIRAQEMMLEDFVPLVKQHRQLWFPPDAKVLTCTSPMGTTASVLGPGFASLEILREAKFNVTYRDHGNAPDVRLALIETIAGYLRRRNGSGDESFAVSDDPSHFLLADREGVRQSPFVHIALEAGYTWDPHEVSVSNKQVRHPREDDKFANAMHCVENIVLNFCAGVPTPMETEKSEKARSREEALNQGQSGYSPHVWMGYSPYI